MSTFVSVGNAHQPFHRLLDAVGSLVDRLPQPVVVQHGHTPFTTAGCRAVAFVSMERFAEEMNAAQLLILHGGAGAVIHAIERGKVPVIIPRQARYGEHIDDHQIEFARLLAGRGKVVLVEDPALLARRVEEALQRQERTRVAAPEKDAEKAEPQMVGVLRELLSRYATEIESGKRR